VPVVAYQGGSKWAQVQATTAGSGYTTVGVRISSVGVGGFSTGGGIGFLAGAHGYASYRFVALNVILPNGDIVNATKQNRYSDLFWAFQGGGGRFGLITTFYQEAVLSPRTLCSVPM
jgi:FAD/FMN-containing dehydrogenase